MSKAKITYVQLANKRTVELKLHEDGALSIAQVQDGDYIRIPEPYLSDFMDALHGLTAVQQQNNSLASALNSYSLAAGMSQQHPRCNSCGVIRSGRKPWYSCNDCGALFDSHNCAQQHAAFSIQGHDVWSEYQ